MAAAAAAVPQMLVLALTQTHLQTRLPTPEWL
jgi:hypothetical protein